MKQILCLLLLGSSFPVFAQMDGSSVFLKGNHVEIGIGKLGYFGSDSVAPAGYHPHCFRCIPSEGIGFVADPLFTGWDTSTTSPTSHYVGDYFLPGNPYEGWELQIDTNRVQAYNLAPDTPHFVYSAGTTMLCTGSNVSYISGGGTSIAVWQGIFDSVQITQTTRLDTGDLFFSVEVTLTNMAVAPKNNIYYARTLDPDNDQTWPGGDFVTDNVINHQNPDSILISVVSAVGLSTPTAYLALGTTDTESRAMIYAAWLLSSSVDLGSVYTEAYSPAYYEEGIHEINDLGLLLTIKVPHLATADSAGDSVLRTSSIGHLHPANSATFSYFYAFGSDAVDSAVVRANNPRTGTVPTLGITSVNEYSVNVYPNPTKTNISVTNLNSSDHVILYDMMGRVVEQNWVVMCNGTNQFKYSDEPAGIYLVTVTDANGAVKARVPVRKL